MRVGPHVKDQWLSSWWLSVKRHRQVAALRAEKRKWELLTAERDVHRSRTGDLEAEVARLKVS